MKLSLNRKKAYWIGLGVVVLIVLFIGLNRYQSNQPVEAQPLSTRGLPPPATDVPVVLPPDPGEAGKATLAGIDSDHDGVRDDLQREIVYMYPQNDQVRRVLRAMVKKGQDVITTTGDHEHFQGLMVSYFAFEDCYVNIIFGPKLTGYNSSDTDKLWNLLQNTSERKKVFVSNDTKGKPYATTAGSANACNNVQGQY